MQMNVMLIILCLYLFKKIMNKNRFSIQTKIVNIDQRSPSSTVKLCSSS